VAVVGLLWPLDFPLRVTLNHSMRLLVLAVVVVGGCAPQRTAFPTPGPVSASNDVPFPYVATSETYYGLDASRLASECDGGNALSCAVLGAALEDGNPDVRGAHRDLSAAATYWVKGCNLGDGGSCHHAGEAFATGKGVAASPQEAVHYFKQSCDINSYRNTLQGFSCSAAGTKLLSIDFVGNYTEAMLLLDKACALQSSTCATKSYYQGTGLKVNSNPPRGAVGFTFGDMADRARQLCQEHRGHIFQDKGASNSSSMCSAFVIDALQETSKYVSFEFCEKKLCDISIALNGTNAYIKKYLDIRAKLVETYGTPSKIALEWPQQCRADDALPKCIERGTVKLSSMWQWTTDELIVLNVLSYQGDVAVVLEYIAAPKARQLGTDGL
jgi:hypothetical protein